MANVKTTYQEAYCMEPKKSECKPEVLLCLKPLDNQPVGGPWAVTRKSDEKARIAQRLPACDEAFFTQVYSEADRGTHRIEPAWRDPRWTDAMRADNSTLYEPAQRDPPNRGNWYVYRSTMADPLTTPVSLSPSLMFTSFDTCRGTT